MRCAQLAAGPGGQLFAQRISMQGIWLQDQHISFCPDLPEPQPQAGEARIRVLKAGVCNTDLELLRGYYTFTGIVGHEFVGVVESEGEWQGKRVCGEINIACGVCRQCRAGRPTHCERRSALGIHSHHGAFANYLTLPYANLQLVPAGVTDDEAVFTEPLAAAVEILEQVHLHPTDAVVVLGDGKLGLLVAQVMATTGCNLLAIGKHREKLQILETRGIRTALITEAPAFYADVVVECTGHANGFALACQFLRPRGTLVLKSTYAGSLTVDMSRVVVDEITLIGSRCGPFAPALDLLARKRVDVTSLIQARYPLHEGVRALERAGGPGMLKVILDIAE
jgi:threonine dehydrogenase-like Zn-dependent dehydrogenase